MPPSSEIPSAAHQVTLAEIVKRNQEMLNALADLPIDALNTEQLKQIESIIWGDRELEHQAKERNRLKAELAVLEQAFSQQDQLKKKRDRLKDCLAVCEPVLAEYNTAQVIKLPETPGHSIIQRSAVGERQVIGFDSGGNASLKDLSLGRKSISILGDLKDRDVQEISKGLAMGDKTTVQQPRAQGGSVQTNSRSRPRARGVYLEEKTCLNGGYHIDVVTTDTGIRLKGSFATHAEYEKYIVDSLAKHAENRGKLTEEELDRIRKARIDFLTS